MRQYNLNFISDQELYNHVRSTVENYSFEMNLKSFNNNLIDPIKLTFDTIVYRQSIEQTIESEVLRQLDKSNSNLIGYFHQNIFEFIGDDWYVPKKGYDIQSTKRKIYVEMKNKHNTMNSSASAKTYMRFQNTLIEDSQAVCLLVEVIAKNSQDIPWTITLDGQKQPPNQRLRRVSIDKFYEIVTGQKFAFKQLCETLPKVIEDVVKDLKKQNKNNTVFKELSLISDNNLKSIYLLAFKRYEGFKTFNFK